MHWESVKVKLPKLHKWVALTDGKNIKMGKLEEIHINGVPKFKWCSCCYDLEEITHWALVDGLPIQE